MISNEEIDVFYGKIPTKGWKLVDSLTLIEIFDQAQLANTQESIIERAEPGLNLLLEEYHLRVLNGKWKDEVNILKEKMKVLQSLLSDIKALNDK